MSRSHRKPGATALMSALVCLLAACAAGPSGGHDTAPTDRGSATSDEVARATAVAREQAARLGAELTGASVTARDGTVSDPNTGQVCGSGRLLHVRLVGSFPSIVTTDDPIEKTEPLAVPDASTRAIHTVHTVLLTADARTGAACRFAVATGEVRRAPGATAIGLE